MTDVKDGRETTTGGSASSIGSNGAREAASADALGPEADLIGHYDPVSFGQAVTELATSLATHPLEAQCAQIRFYSRLVAAAVDTVTVAMGLEASSTLEAPPKDRRFSDPA